MTSEVLSYTKVVVMISLKRCEEILNKAEKKYSPHEIKIIRDQLIGLSLIEYEHYRETKTCQTGDYLHKGIDGRTSTSRV